VSAGLLRFLKVCTYRIRLKMRFLDKPIEQLKEEFGIAPEDFSQEDEDKIKKEFDWVTKTFEDEVREFGEKP
jgi:hypothetical protein